MQPAIFEEHEIRRVYDEEAKTWWFSVVDIVQVLTQQPHYQIARKYWNKLKERLAHDLRTAFPEMKGFSPRNLKYMRAFADDWPDAAIAQQAVGQLPWGHNQVLLDRLNTLEEGLK